MYKLKVLVCDDMEHVRLAHEDALFQCGQGIFQPVVSLAETAEEAVEIARTASEAQAPFDLILMDVHFGNADGIIRMTGFQAATAIHGISPQSAIAMISSYDTAENQMLAEEFAYVDKFFRRGSFNRDEFKDFCIYALIRSLHTKNILIESKSVAYTQAPVMIRYLKRVDQVGADDTVTIYGETGTGKQLSAERLSANARVATGKPERPFVSMNCAGLTPTLLMAELFGHGRGAFTGANQDRAGWIEKAHEGDLFLDELQNAPEDFQMALLGVLETGKFSRVGTTEVRRVKVRVIAALNQSPNEAIKAGVLREDLLGRLQQRYLVIPSLRDRKGDIPVLIEYFRKRQGKADKTFSPEAVEFLDALPWKTNIRGLKAVVASAIKESKLPMISVTAIKRLDIVKDMLAAEPPVDTDPTLSESVEPLQTTRAGGGSRSWESKARELAETSIRAGVPLETIVSGVERAALSLLMKQEGLLARVARKTKLSESTLRGKFKKHGLAFES